MNSMQTNKCPGLDGRNSFWLKASMWFSQSAFPGALFSVSAQQILTLFVCTAECTCGKYKLNLGKSELLCFPNFTVSLLLKWKIVAWTFDLTCVSCLTIQRTEDETTVTCWQTLLCTCMFSTFFLVSLFSPLALVFILIFIPPPLPLCCFLFFHLITSAWQYHLLLSLSLSLSLCLFLSVSQGPCWIYKWRSWPLIH